MDDATPRAAPVVQPPVRAPEQGGWRSVALLGTGAFAIGTDMFGVAGVLGDLAADLDVPVGAAGLAVTAFGLAYAIGATLLTALLGAQPLHRALLGSMLLLALFDLASAVAPTLPVLLVARVLGGLAASVYLPAAGAAAVAAVPASHRGRALGVILAGGSVAVVLGAPLGAQLAAALSWRAMFVLVAAFALATAFGLAISGVGSGPSARVSLRERLRPMRSPVVACVLGVTFLMATASNSMFTYLAVLLGAAPEGIGTLIAVFGLGGVAGTWWGGRAADRWGRQVVPVAATVLMACFAGLTLGTPATLSAGASRRGRSSPPNSMMAQAYPRTTIVGSDYHGRSIELARKKAADTGVADRVSFEVSTAQTFTGTGYDLVTMFDALHDMGDPVGAARRVREALAPDGTWLLVEPAASDKVEENFNPVGRLYYAGSTFLCVPNGLSQEGGYSLGAQAGEAAIREVITEAGFTRFRRAAQSAFNLVYEIRP